MKSIKNGTHGVGYRNAGINQVTIADVRCDVCWRVFGTGGGGLPAGRTARIYSNPHRRIPAVEQHEKWKTKLSNSGGVTETASSLFLHRTLYWYVADIIFLPEDEKNLFTPLPNMCGVCVAHPSFSTQQSWSDPVSNYTDSFYTLLYNIVPE
jgi:hypothetical protein